MLAHLAGDVGKYFVSAIQFDPVHCGGQNLQHDALGFNRLFFLLRIHNWLQDTSAGRQLQRLFCDVLNCDLSGAGNYLRMARISRTFEKPGEVARRRFPDSLVPFWTDACYDESYDLVNGHVSAVNHGSASSYF